MATQLFLDIEHFKRGIHEMELWYTEKQTANYGITAKIEETLHTEQSEFQRIDLIDTLQWGKMLVLDGMVMTTDKDEFV